MSVTGNGFGFESSVPLVTVNGAGFEASLPIGSVDGFSFETSRPIGTVDGFAFETDGPPVYYESYDQWIPLLGQGTTNTTESYDSWVPTLGQGTTIVSELFESWFNSEKNPIFSGGLKDNNVANGDKRDHPLFYN